MKKTALLFGSFNPIHEGHLAILRYLLAQPEVDEVRLVVSPQSPFKRGQGLVDNALERLEGARAAIAEAGLAVTVSDVEFHLPEPWYTIDTLRFLQREEPDREFVLVMGGDNIPSLERWHKGGEILRDFAVWVYPRPGTDAGPVCDRLNSLPGTKGVRLFSEAPQNSISSTEIRNRKKCYIVDAFTDCPFGGNTAGVVLIRAGQAFPPDEWMRQVAAELRYSETAFVRQDGPAAFTVRYFTPCGEVDLCGHATIAAFGMLFREGVVPADNPCTCHTKAGDLEILPGETVMMQMASPQRLSRLDDPVLRDALLAAMGGLSSDALAPLPVEIISTGLPDILLPLRDEAALQGLAPDMEALARFSEQLGVVGVHAFAADADAAAGQPLHVRNFAPRYGIPEESATGTANAALTAYLFLNGLLPAEATCRFVQGEAMGRPSTILTRLSHSDGHPDIRVGGSCAIVLQGTLKD